MLDALKLDLGAKRFALIVALTALVIGVYHDSFRQIFVLWTRGNYQHCFIVFPTVFYMLWRRRAALVNIRPEPNVLGLVILLGLVLIWYLGRAIAVQAVEHITSMMLIPAAVLAFLGYRLFAQVAFPLLLLLTAIPIGEELAPLLMTITADIATALLELSGVPVTRQGVYLSLPGGDFEIARVCAGVNYLLTALTLGLLFSYMTFHSWRRRLVFVAATVALFVVGNGVRAFIVMYVASATRLKYFAGPDHVIFGMIFFMALLLASFAIGRRYADSPPAEPPTDPALPAGFSLQPRAVAIAVSALAALAGGPAAHAFQQRALPAAESLQLREVDGCIGPEPWRANWAPVMQAADSEVRGSYRCGQAIVHVFAAAYARQQQGAELIGGGNVLVPDRWWMADARRDVEATLPNGKLAVVNQVNLEASGQSLTAWYWYEVNGRVVRSAYGVKFQEALAALLLRPAISRAYLVAAAGPRGSTNVSESVPKVASAIGGAP